ncbi:MAG: hypothetical protein RL318_1204, partial [Fibrobacterota bacterium]
MSTAAERNAPRNGEDVAYLSYMESLLFMISPPWYPRSSP